MTGTRRKIQLPRSLRYRIQRSQTVGPVMLAITVGALAAAWAILFRVLIRGVQWLFLERGGALVGRRSWPDGLNDLHLLFAPAVGLALVVLLVRRWAPEARGHGVPEVQHAVREKGGRIRPRVVLVKALASALTIGTGGSVGREGPIVQVGSAVGSTTGQLAGLGPEQVKLLVACGAAGGIGATFNAPIAGVLFALEVILGSFAARSFGLVVVSSVSATALSQAVLGREPAFRLVQSFSLVSERELLLYLALGVLLGVTATVYNRSIYLTEDLFDRWHTSPVTKGFIGGLGVGAIGFFGSAQIFGVGYEGVELALAGDLAVRTLLLLVVLKIIATSVTLGAGGSGGVFAPALFIGAMAGGAFGHAASALFPAWTAPSGAYALVGMAALFGAAAHAPITAVLILFEMTDDYQIILPLMLAVGVSYLVASHVYSESVYSLKLRRLRGRPGKTTDVSVLDMLLVADAMLERFETVEPELTLEALAELAGKRRTRSWPVMNARGELIGIVTETDFERALIQGDDGGHTVAEIMTTSVVTLGPADTLRMAFRRFSEHDVQQIPVVDDPEGRHLVGLLRRHEMLWAYKTLSDEHELLLKSRPRARPLASAEVVQEEFLVRRDDRRVAGHRIREATIPGGVLISLVRRSGRPFVPGGDTKLKPGDLLVLLTTQEHESEMRDWIARASKADSPTPP